MTAKTTDLWLSRDPDGTYWVSEEEPEKRLFGDSWDWEWDKGEPLVDVPVFFPALRKGTKRRIRVTVEVLR